MPAEPAKEAVERLFERYADEIYRFARYSLGRPAEAEDVVQEVFLRAMRGWGRYAGRASERTWLFGIARHVVTDIIRRRAHADARPVEPAREVPPPGELRADLEASLRLLSLAQRQVFILRIVEDRTVEDVAATLGRSRVWVRVTLHRALARLRQELGGDVGTLRREGGTA